MHGVMVRIRVRVDVRGRVRASSCQGQIKPRVSLGL